MAKLDDATLAFYVEDLAHVNATELRAMAFHATGVRVSEVLPRARLVEIAITKECEEEEESHIQKYQDFLLDYFESHPYVLTSQPPCNCRGTMCPPAKVVFDSRSWKSITGTLQEELP